MEQIYAWLRASVPAETGVGLMLRCGGAPAEWAGRTAALKYFTGQLIFAHGSLADFWGCTTGGQTDPQIRVGAGNQSAFWKVFGSTA